jgi:hypothetical protein
MIRNSTLRYVPRKMKTYPSTKTCAQIFIAALLIIIPKWKKLTCLSTDEWINEMWTIHKWNIILAMKRKEVLIRTCYSIDEPWKHACERSQTSPLTRDV